MRRAALTTGIVLIGIAYILGFWPQYNKEQSTERQLQTVARLLSTAQEQVSLCRLQHQLLAVVMQTEQKNFGQASTLATSFFNAISDRMPGQSDDSVKAALRSILEQRDSVIAALAKADPGSLGLLHPLETSMFQAVDRSMGSAGLAPAAHASEPVR